MEWVSDCCLKPIQQFFSYIMTRTSQLNFQWDDDDDDDDDVCFVPDHTLCCIFIVLAHWNNSPRVDMTLHSDTLFWFRANQSLLFLLNAVCLAEKQQIPANLSLWFDQTGARSHDLPHSWTWKNLLKYDISNSNVDMYVFVNQYVVDAKI